MLAFDMYAPSGPPWSSAQSWYQTIFSTGVSASQAQTMKLAACGSLTGRSSETIG
jgi:hypothetical protein